MHFIGQISRSGHVLRSDCCRRDRYQRSNLPCGQCADTFDVFKLSGKIVSSTVVRLREKVIPTPPEEQTRKSHTSLNQMNEALQNFLRTIRRPPAVEQPNREHIRNRSTLFIPALQQVFLADIDDIPALVRNVIRKSALWLTPRQGRVSKLGICRHSPSGANPALGDTFWFTPASQVLQIPAPGIL
jgi:hypothetical protein